MIGIIKRKPPYVHHHPGHLEYNIRLEISKIYVIYRYACCANPRAVDETD